MTHRKSAVVLADRRIPARILNSLTELIFTIFTLILSDKRICLATTKTDFLRKVKKNLRHDSPQAPNASAPNTEHPPDFAGSPQHFCASSSHLFRGGQPASVQRSSSVRRHRVRPPSFTGKGIRPELCIDHHKERETPHSRAASVALMSSNLFSPTWFICPLLYCPPASL